MCKVRIAYDITVSIGTLNITLAHADEIRHGNYYNNSIVRYTFEQNYTGGLDACVLFWLKKHALRGVIPR